MPPPSATPAAFQHELTQLLTHEAEVVARFVELLENEQAELQAGRIENLESIVTAKAPLVQELNQLAETRSRLITSAGYTMDRSGMTALLASCTHTESKRMWEQLQAQARQARQLNELNGRLIAQHLQSTNGALQVLLQRTPRHVLDVYGPNGQKLDTPTGSRLIDSV